MEVRKTLMGRYFSAHGCCISFMVKESDTWEAELAPPGTATLGDHTVKDSVLLQTLADISQDGGSLKMCGLPAETKAQSAPTGGTPRRSTDSLIAFDPRHSNSRNQALREKTAWGNTGECLPRQFCVDLEHCKYSWVFITLASQILWGQSPYRHHPCSLIFARLSHHFDCLCPKGKASHFSKWAGPTRLSVGGILFYTQVEMKDSSTKADFSEKTRDLQFWVVFIFATLCLAPTPPHCPKCFLL